MTLPYWSLVRRAQASTAAEAPRRQPAVDRLLLVNRPRLATAVVPAVGAHAVRRLRLVAVRTFAEAYRPQRIVRPPIGRARLGMASFWVRHDFGSSQKGISRRWLRVPL